MFKLKNKVNLLFLVVLVALGATLFYFLDLGIKQPQTEMSLEEIERTLGYHASRHAKERMEQRSITANDIFIALEKGDKYEDTEQKSYSFHYNGLNVIVANKTIVTTYRGKAKKRWKKVHE